MSVKIFNYMMLSYRGKKDESEMNIWSLQYPP